MVPSEWNGEVSQLVMSIVKDFQHVYLRCLGVSL